MNEARGRPNAGVARLLCALVMVIGVVACGPASESTTTGGGATDSTAPTDGTLPETISITVLLPGDATSLTYPANILGQARFYEEEGLDVEFAGHEGAGYVAQQMAAGTADFGVITSNALIIAVGQGAEVKGVASLDHDLFQMVVPEDSDIQSVDDLAGRVLGIPDSGASSASFAQAVLEDAGLVDEVDVVVVGDAGPGILAAFQGGQIDAFNGTINDIGGLQAAGAIELRSIVPDKYAGMPLSEFAVSDAALATAEGREAAIRFMRAWKKGLEFLDSNFDEAMDLICEIATAACEDRENTEGVVTRSAEAGSFTGQFGVHDLDVLNVVGQEMIPEDALDDEVPDAAEVFTDELIDEINRG